MKKPQASDAKECPSAQRDAASANAPGGYSPPLSRVECVAIARTMADDEAVEPELRLFAQSALQWLEIEGDFADA